MKLQSYNEKSDLLLSNRFPKSESVLNINPISENLSFYDLHEICKHDNVIALPLPNVVYNLHTMKYVSDSKAPGVRDASDIVIRVKNVYHKSIEEFIEIANNNIVFYYSGTNKLGQYTLRYEAYPKELFQPFIDRLSAIENLELKLNFNNSTEDIKAYVNSEEFDKNKTLMIADFTEYYKEIYKSFNNEDERPQYIIESDTQNRLTEGLPICEL